MARRLAPALLLASLGVAALPASNAYACSCVAPETDVLSGTVFYGDVLGREETGSGVTYVVAVKRVYAGSAGAVTEVHTTESRFGCGLNLPPSGPAVFFSRERDGRVTASACDGSRPAPDGPPKTLGAGYAPVGATAFAPEGDRTLPIAVAAAAVLGLGALVVRRRTA